MRCWDVKSAGGFTGKPRENGLSNGDSSTVRGYGDGDNNER